MVCCSLSLKWTNTLVASSISSSKYLRTIFSQNYGWQDLNINVDILGDWISYRMVNLFRAVIFDFGIQVKKVLRYKHQHLYKKNAWAFQKLIFSSCAKVEDGFTPFSTNAQHLTFERHRSEKTPTKIRNGNSEILQSLHQKDMIWKPPSAENFRVWFQ